MTKPTKIAYEIPYSDGSGVEFKVAYEGKVIETDLESYIELEYINSLRWPVGKLEWLIDRLNDIAAEVVDDQAD